MTNLEELQVLLEFIKICNHGSVKPYDSATVMQNLMRSRGIEVESIKKVMECCPPSAEVRDAKDFIPYRNAALKRVAELLNLEIY